MTAIRVANVPEPEFEQAIESEHPPTVTELAERGKKPAAFDMLKGRDPKDFKAATKLLGLASNSANDFQSLSLNIEAAIRGCSPEEMQRLKLDLLRLKSAVSELVRRLPK